MLMNTTAEVISFSERLENESALFYEKVARKYGKQEALFNRFAGENRKNNEQIKRSYYGSITDAIEGCFGFKLNSDDYRVDFSLPAESGFTDALEKALAIETTMIRFYEEAAKQTRSLMTDVARTFVMAAKKRDKRNARIKEILAV